MNNTQTVNSRSIGLSTASSASSELPFSSISWRAILAGFFVTLLSYLILTAFGIAFTANSVGNAIENSAGSGLGVGTGIWLLLSVLVSLFAGSFAAGRVAGQIPIRIGRTQGMVVAALFFMFLFSALSGPISLLGRGISSSVSVLGSASGDLSQNPQVQDTIESAIGDQANLKSPPTTVAQGIASRLLRGDKDGARNYLARQTGMTPGQADQRIQSVQAQVQAIAKTVGSKAAHAVSIAGWTLFGTFLLGALTAMLGGAAGAKANLVSPVSQSDRNSMDQSLRRSA